LFALDKVMDVAMVTFWSYAPSVYGVLAGMTAVSHLRLFTLLLWSLFGAILF